MSLYYKSRYLLSEGALVAPNWGHYVLSTGPDHPSFFTEYVLESERRKSFPEKPSRTESVFAFENYDYACNWHPPERGRHEEYVYEVSTEAEEFHRGDITCIDAMRKCRTFEGIERFAHRYWSGEECGPNSWERVIKGTLTVVKRMTPIAENGIGQ